MNDDNLVFLDQRNMFPLMQGFPTLRDVDLTVWDAEKLDEWACGPEPGTGALYAARFVLSVHNPKVDWKCGKFDVVRAMQIWDNDHRSAFLKWANDPWFL